MYKEKNVYNFEKKIIKFWNREKNFLINVVIINIKTFNIIWKKRYLIKMLKLTRYNFVIRLILSKYCFVEYKIKILNITLLIAI